MPLQIRRGTNAERLALSVPLAQGEPLWVTDDRKLYVGDGTTLAGSLVPVSGFGAEEAADAAAAALTSGVHSNISFSYDDANDRINATVSVANLLENLNLNNFNIVGTGNINIAGSFTGDFKGSIFSDSSLLLVDALDGKINLDGTVKGDIIPNSNEAYDIGSSSFRFKDLYLSGTSLYLGSAQITAAGSAIDLPIGSTVGGIPIPAPNPTSTSLVLDIQGSVFGDDSTMLVDGTNSVLRTNLLELTTDYIKSSSGNIYLGDTTDQISLSIAGTVGTPAQMQISSALDGSPGLTQFGPGFRLSSFNGTFASPTALITGDLIGQVNFQGKLNAGSFGLLDVDAVSIRAVVEDGGDLVSNIAEGKLQIAFVHGPDPNDTVLVEIGSYGNLTAPSIQPGTYADAAARDAYITSPSAGMIVYLSSTSKFTGYVDDAGAGSPGWVNLN